jgi:molybdate transport system regulatory protein
VADAGSIKQAAAQLGKSYRYVWGRIKQTERALGQPLVQTQVGGTGDQRSSLTPQARKYAVAFLALRRRVTDETSREFRRHFGAV